MSQKRYDPSVKAAAIAALLAGQSVSEVAREYSLPKGTVSSWRQRQAGGVASNATQKRDEIGGLLVDYLHANLSTLKAQQTVFADPEWLKKQDAQELAVLHGVMTDKAIRLLEALGGAAPTSNE
jgi:transposase-like protein